jgi:trehalose 6-phosphate phosphatase
MRGRPALLASPGGRAALARALRAQPLLAFDFDGTLAPIVERPDQARVDPALATALARLATQLPVAVITGRRVADARARLGFSPRHLVGNHGAEGCWGAAVEAALAAELDGLRAVLAGAADELARLAVRVEDKGLSIALHYRGAPDPQAARAGLDALLAGLPDHLHRFGGKAVLNLASAAAPDKAAALLALVEREGRAAAVFVGDDLNDEPVFERAPAHWLTVRIGPPHEATAARYTLPDQASLATMIDAMGQLLST